MVVTMYGDFNTYLYQPSILLELSLILAIVCFIFKPQYLTALIACILLLRPNERFGCLLPYPKIVLSMLILILLTRCISLKSMLHNRDIKPLLAFISLIIAQSLLFHRYDLFNNVMFMSVGLSFYLAVILFMSDDKGIKLLGYVTVISFFLICLEPLYYHYTALPGSQLWNLFHHDERIQAWGMWANPNETAFIACVGAANLLSLTIRLRKSILYLVSAAALPFFMLVVFLTGSRAGLASLLLLFLPLIVLIKSKPVKLFIIVSVIGILAVSQLYTPQRKDKEASAEDRFDLRYMGRQLFLEHPLMGVGFQQAVEENRGQPLHNTYVQAFAETGALGGILLIMFIYRVGHRLYACLKLNMTNNSSQVANIAVSAGLYLSSVFYFYWGNQLLSIMFFLIMGQTYIITNVLSAENCNHGEVVNI